MKTDGHLGRTFLKDEDGNQANAVLTSTAHNFRLILAWLRYLLRLIRALILESLPSAMQFSAAS